MKRKYRLNWTGTAPCRSRHKWPASCAPQSSMAFSSQSTRCLRPEDSQQNWAFHGGVVVRAFEQLAGEGFLESNGSGGTKVAVRPDMQPPPPLQRETTQQDPRSRLT